MICHYQQYHASPGLQHTLSFSDPASRSSPWSLHPDLSTCPRPPFLRSTSICPRPPFLRSTSPPVHDHRSFVLPLYLSTTTFPSFYLSTCPRPPFLRSTSISRHVPRYLSCPRPPRYPSRPPFLRTPTHTTPPTPTHTTPPPPPTTTVRSFYLSTCPRPPSFVLPLYLSTPPPTPTHTTPPTPTHDHRSFVPPLHLSRPPFVRPTSPPVTTTVRSFYLSTCPRPPPPLHLSTTTVRSFYLSICPPPPIFRSTSLSVQDHRSFDCFSNTFSILDSRTSVFKHAF
ncbi:hypothetical protein J6590_060240 [Homalodisca vitripennis]|nr:hypothetical protein J6590_060240 [Homalodisca vitripennis]